MSNPQPHVAEKSATYEIREQFERSMLWPRLPLTKVIDLNPKPERGSLSDELQVSFVPMAAVEAGTGAIDASAVRRYAEVKKGYTYFREGDVLFAKITPCMENGKMAVARQLRNGIGFGSTEFHVLRPREGVDAHYVYHYVSSARFRAEAAHHMTGAVGQKRVPAAFLEQSEIPLPTIDEQRCIVAEIEKQFSRLDEAVADLKRVKTNLKRYKTAVLKAAVEGRLVPTEVASAPAGLPLGWQEITLGEVIESMKNGIYKPRSAYADDGIACLRMYNIENGRIVWKDIKRMILTPDEVHEYQLIPGDLLVNRVNSRELVGKAAPIPSGLETCVFESKNIRVRLRRDIADPCFIGFTMSVFGPEHFNSNAQQVVGMASISQPQVSALPINLPPLGDQRRIVAEVERRLSVADEIESETDVNLQRAERLKRSILSKAFKFNTGGER